ncbi:MAG: mutarotase, partial [Bacteroidia bacterium]
MRSGNKAKERGDSLAYNTFLKWKKDYLLKEAKDYKFNDKVLSFNTITKKWAIVDSTSYAAKASTVLVPYKQGGLLINGELKPGIRTDEVYQITISAEPFFGWTNWIVLVLYLVGMLYLGYYFMKKEQSTNDFFTGGGRIPWWAAGISIFATMLSAITFMAIPAKVYATDWKYFPMAVTILVMAFPVIKYYLPFFRRLNVTTAYEYLEVRFNYSTRFLASFLFIVFMVARMALVLFLPSLALTTVTGIDIYMCIILMGVITLIYCTMGGVEAVVWGDVIQGIVLMGGAILAVVFLVSGTEGGWNTIMQISISEEKFKMFDWSWDLSKATIWVVVLGGLANNLISYS